MKEKLDLNLKEEKDTGYCKPPNKFSATNQPKNHPGRPKGISLTTLLKNCLEKKIKYEDPETQQIINGRVKDAIVWRLILNATQGDNHAIKEILDRIDGRLPNAPIIDNSKHTHYTTVINQLHSLSNGKKEEGDNGRINSEASNRLIE